MKVALIQPPMNHFPIDRPKHLLVDFLLISGVPYFLNELGLRINQFKPLFFPLGLANISTPLINNGIDVRIFDANVEKNIIKKVKNYYPDIIGFSCKTAPSLLWIDYVSKVLKNETDAKIVFGGSHVTISPHQTLETTVADFIVIGEGDNVFLKLVKSIDNKKKLPKDGIGYKKNGKIVVGKPVIIKNLDSLPIPDLSIFKMKKYRIYVIQKSRGCNRKCDFCYLTAFNSWWRSRGVDHILKEINYIHSEFGDYKFLFADENLTEDLIGLRKLCKKLIGEYMWWETEIGRFLSTNDIKLLERAGCRYVHLGVDAPPSWFNSLPKYRSVEEIYRFSKRLKKTKIGFGASYIIMAPDESKKDLEDIYKLILKTKADFVDISIFRPYPNTTAYINLLKRGFMPPRSFRAWGNLLRDILSLKSLDKINFTKDETTEDIVKFLLKVFLHSSNLPFKFKQQFYYRHL